MQKKQLFLPQWGTRHQRLTPIIPATQEAQIRMTEVPCQPRPKKKKGKTYLKIYTQHKKGLVEWFK
jgi:hypothetical protein